MDIGLLSFVTDESMPIVDLATEAEARGFESLFVPEKTHLPVSRRTPWPGGTLSDAYKRSFDPFVALTAAAAVTKRIRLGTGICMAVARDPIITAKEVACCPYSTHTSRSSSDTRADGWAPRPSVRAETSGRRGGHRRFDRLPGMGERVPPDGGEADRQGVLPRAWLLTILLP